MPTLLNYLSTPDPDLDRSRVRKGPNTFNPAWDVIEETREWTDFTYPHMMEMLSEILNRNYDPNRLDMPPPLRGHVPCIVNESTVTAVLLKWQHVIVGRALDLASRRTNTVSWSLGCYGPLTDASSDWAGVEPDLSSDINRIPGDTKVSGKWHTRLLRKSDGHRKEFFKPLRQVNFYAQLANSRYAYVISDKELLCMRRNISEYEGVPLSSQRPVRGARQPTTPDMGVSRITRAPSIPSASPPFRVVIPTRPQHFLSPERQPRPRRDSVTSRMSAMSLDSPAITLSPPGETRSSSSRFTDNGNPDVNEGVVEVVVIPWGENRPGHLTINLALFWIHILAAFDVDLRPSYPPLGRELAEAYGLRAPARRG
ncbi:hypothetical protein BO78DRAFT_405621 [Aspergillus sclerotiicarbonarius CBS 121057]|uniref:Uncharacterized protein n=1 Tax=Aspergillus sclerotiicarbonarius (strain CBS 121057 / IBT 28362) TaxID=1448318 RepID=A0A319EEM2_ASPSB|nr:hypothetical protein BO78DRAFT_405621 [Aspergillus sclerotiicarbonarius CBS 121057]